MAARSSSKIRDSIEEWRKQLLDLTKRNRLVSCKIDARGAVSLEHPSVSRIWESLFAGDELVLTWKRDLFDDFEEPEDEDSAQLSLFGATEGENAGRAERRFALQDCLESPKLRLNDVLTPLADKALGGRLNRLSLNARTALSEQGVNVLFVAVGLLTWFESEHSDISITSPLLLVPVTLERSGTAAPWRLSLYEDEIAPNHCLRELFRRDFKLLLPEPDCDKLVDDPGERERYLSAVREAVKEEPRWEVSDRAVIGQFSFQKLSMYEDYGANASEIAEHPNCLRIAGDATAPPPQGLALCAPSEFDETIHPKTLHTVLPCDASQLEAILAVKEGASLVLDGPPGTGKSQTIANIIADCLASHKTVLFVSEKAAALDVVKRRLEQRQLSDFVLDCHSHKASKKEIIAELDRCLRLNLEQYTDRKKDLERLFQCRKKLNNYVAALHKPTSSLDLSPFEVNGRLVALEDAPVSYCKIADVLKIDATLLQAINESLATLVDCREAVETCDFHPWRGCRITQSSLLLEEEISERFSSLAEGLQQWAMSFEPIAEAGLCRGPLTVDEGHATLEMLNASVPRSPIPSSWFSADARRLADSITRLVQLNEGFARALADAPEFTSSALDHLSAFAQAEQQIRHHSGNAYLRPFSASTLRSFASHLRTLCSDLRLLASRCDEVEQAADEVIETLNVPVSNTTMGGLEILSELAQVISQSGPMKESWFDESRTDKLTQFATQGRKADEELTSRKGSLERLFQPSALSGHGQDVALKALRYRGVWRRWLPGWRSVRRGMEQLYLAPAPCRTSELLVGMDELRRYHKDAEVFHKRCAEAPDALICRPDGSVNWSATIKGIAAVVQLRKILRNPNSLKQLLCSSDALDRTELAHWSELLNASLEAFSESLARCRDRFKCTRPPGDRRYTALSAADYASWLREEAGALEECVTKIEAVLALCSNGYDVAIDDSSRRLAALRRAHSIREKARALYRAELADVAKTDTPEAHSWDHMLDHATFVMKAFEEYDGTIPPAIVSVITDTSVRRTVMSAGLEAERIYTRQIEPGWGYLAELFPVDEKVSGGVVLNQMSMTELSDWLKRQTDQVSNLRQWLDFLQAQESLSRSKAKGILDEVFAGKFSIEKAWDAFLARFYRLWLDAVCRDRPALREFRLETHERLIEEFCQLDKEAIEHSTGRVRSTILNHPERPHAEMLGAPASSELGVLLREVNKKRRHLPLRQLFARVPNLLLRLKPCLMMSPLAVSTYLNSRELRFDVVIFDEASQVLPWDAIGAVYRGRQLVVAGDQKQLPPTTFFDRLVSGEELDEESDDLADFESVLDVLCSVGVPRKRLRWHYRSRRETLIAFSNRHYYDGELVTFPSPEDLENSSSIRFRFVEDGRWRSNAGFNPIEARHVAQEVCEHFRQRPHKTLGVITFNQRQQLAVLDELVQLRSKQPDLEPMFSDGRVESFFVKNLENVQGDERDYIILSVAYGRDDTSDKLAMRFGPLNNQGGERRLNVAITRAREGITLVSSIRAEDIDLRRTNATGVRLLKAYLHFGECGPRVLGSDVTEDCGESESPFEEAVARALQERGLDVRRQVGCGRFRIDLAIVDRAVPGRYLLGIECDGATYHRTVTARDRDRIRQELLEQLGWRIVRVWSTDWVRDPQCQIDRILSAYRESLSSPPSCAPKSEPDVCTNGERPVIRMRPNDIGVSPGYRTIDEVPEKELKRVIIALTVRYGATPREELVRSAARELGFQRTGHIIQKRILEAIDRLLRDGRLRSGDEDRVAIS